MIRINNNNVQLSQKNDNTWRKAQCSSLVDRLKIGGDTTTSDVDVDAIAAAMDESQNDHEYNVPNTQCVPSKEDVMNAMISNYVRQNGSITDYKSKNENDVKGKNVLFG